MKRCPKCGRILAEFKDAWKCICGYSEKKGDK